MADGPTPVTIVSGFLGAGKTTLVNHLLTASADRKIAVLVNDFGEVNIDSQLIVDVADDVISLANGCICCSMKNDVVQAVFRVLEANVRPEHILVEASGISNPGALAEIFLKLERDRLLRLDGIAAVVDAEQFPFDDLKRQPVARDQVLAADLLILNKSDLVDSERLDALEAAVRKRVPHARILRAERAQVPAEVVLGLDRESTAPVHTASMHASPALEDHGFVSFVFRSEVPIAFKAFVHYVEDLPKDVLRMKGVLVPAESPTAPLMVHVVGKRVHAEPWPDPVQGTTLAVIGQSGLDQTLVESGLHALERD